jgi:predicted polyphosphate/ATP-dependent NAD kinase
MSGSSFGRRAASAGVESPTAAAEAGTLFRRGSNPNPHRLTIDVDDALYRRLKLAALERGERMAVIVREALNDSLPK